MALNLPQRQKTGLENQKELDIELEHEQKGKEIEIYKGILFALQHPYCYFAERKKIEFNRASAMSLALARRKDRLDIGSVFKASFTFRDDMHTFKTKLVRCG